MNFLGTRNISNQAGLWQQRRSYQLQRDRQLQTLRSQWLAQVRERAVLSREAELLQRSLSIAGDLDEQLFLLSAANEMEAELLLNRRIDLLRRQKRMALLGALQGQTTARINQTSGISL